MCCPIPLPLPLLRLVIFFLHPHDHRSTLAALRRLSRASYDLATPTLYSDIVFSSRGLGGLLPLPINPLPIDEDATANTERINKLSEVIPSLQNEELRRTLAAGVELAKIDGIFHLALFAPIRRLYHLQFSVTLRLADVPIHHPFWEHVQTGVRRQDGYPFSILSSIKNIVVLQSHLDAPNEPQNMVFEKNAVRQQIRCAMYHLCGSNVKDICCPSDLPNSTLVEDLVVMVSHRSPSPNERGSITIHQSHMRYCRPAGIDRTLNRLCNAPFMVSKSNLQSLERGRDAHVAMWMHSAGTITTMLKRGDRVDIILDTGCHCQEERRVTEQLKQKLTSSLTTNAILREQASARLSVWLKGEKMCDACGEPV